MNESERFDVMTAVTLNNATTALSYVDGVQSTKSQTQTPLTYEVLASRMHAMLHPTGGAYTSPELKATLETFWENFQKNIGA
jgi:hypothetical protein